MSGAARHDHEANQWPYKMKDLCERTGLGRQAIHFYIQRGLLPPGRKTGHNMAYYSEAHLERIQLIRQLQHERFLPLDAIKAILDEQEGLYSPVQRDFLRSVRSSLKKRTDGPAVDVVTDVPVRDVLAKNIIAEGDLTRLIELDVIGIQESPDGTLYLSQRDLTLLKLAGELRRVGMSEGRGFAIDAIVQYKELISQLVDWEGQLVVEHLGALPPDEAAQAIAKALPLIDQILAHFHAARVNDLLDSM